MELLRLNGLTCLKSLTRLKSLTCLISLICLPHLHIIAFGERHKHPVTLLQFVSGLLHFGVGIDQFLYADTILFGYSENGLTLLNFVNITPFGGLSFHLQSKQQGEQNEGVV